MIKDNVWFNVREVLDKDKLVNMITGARGIGKTYSSLVEAYEEYQNKGTSTIYLRRYKSELKKFNTIFNPLIQDGKIKDEDAGYDKYGRHFIDKKTNKTICEAIALSQAVSLKSASFDTVGLVIFDEFILDKSTLHYIPDEFELFNNFIETISRLGEITTGRVVKILMLANASSRNNPYFIGYNIPVIDKNWYIHDDLLVYQPDQKDFKNLKLQTRWGKFVNKNTKMSGYMLDGNFNDKKQFIASLPAKTGYIATLKYLDKKIGVFADYQNSIVYLSTKYNNNNNLTYALTNADSSPNYLIFKANNRLFQMLKNYWETGNLRFTDLKIQTIFLDILKLL